MGGKVPVGATISRAYRFAFTNIVNNLGAIWVPAVLLWAASYFLFVRNNATAQIISGGPEGLRPLLPVILASWAVMFVLITSQMAALTREALGLRTGNPFLQNPFTAPMWRLLLSYIFFVLAVMAIYIAILVAALVGALLLGVLIQVLPGRGTAALSGLVGIVGMLVCFGGLTYAIVRLSFLIAPVAIAERSVSLFRGWHLTRGNFWRIFAVLLCISLPFVVAEIVYLHEMYEGQLFPPLALWGRPDLLAQWQQHQRDVVLASTMRMQHYWYIVYPLGLLFMLIFCGLFAGASAFSYQSLTEPPPADRT